MAVRSGLIREEAKRKIIDGAKEVLADIVEEGGDKIDALKYCRHLVWQSIYNRL